MNTSKNHFKQNKFERVEAPGIFNFIYSPYLNSISSYSSNKKIPGASILNKIPHLQKSNCDKQLHKNKLAKNICEQTIVWFYI